MRDARHVGARPARAVRIEARAKLNLGLAVGPRRPDGYHEIATVYQSISLADTLVIRPRRGGFRLRVRWEETALSGAPRRERLGPARDNLVLRAARLFRTRAGFHGGASFDLVKRIPAGAGLGGGSSDAAATLAGLERIAGIRLAPAERMDLAARLGSDVPFACRGGTAIGFGRGEKLQKVRLSRSFGAIVAVPSWRVSTVDAYRRLDRSKYALTGWRANLRFAQILESDEVTPILCVLFGNSFESALGNRMNSFMSLSRRLQEAGLRSPRLTGSGSAVFGILRPGETFAAVVGRFEGSERLYRVKSARTGLRVIVDRD